MADNLTGKTYAVLWNAEALVAAAVLTSAIIPVRWINNGLLYLKASSAAGAADVKIESQGVMDREGTDTLAYVTVQASTAAKTDPEGWNRYSFNEEAPFIRFKVTEITAGGVADTLISAKLMRQYA